MVGLQDVTIHADQITLITHGSQRTLTVSLQTLPYSKSYYNVIDVTRMQWAILAADYLDI